MPLVRGSGNWKSTTGAKDEPLEEWAWQIVARGARPSFEKEQVLPGADPDDWESDPILDASDLRAAGDRRGAERILVEMSAADLRCLDAHAQLGNFGFERNPGKAIRHYEAGFGSASFRSAATSTAF